MGKILYRENRYRCMINTDVKRGVAILLIRIDMDRGGYGNDHDC